MANYMVEDLNIDTKEKYADSFTTLWGSNDIHIFSHEYIVNGY